jgi:hypothetical protein
MTHRTLQRFIDRCRLLDEDIPDMFVAYRKLPDQVPCQVRAIGRCPNPVLVMNKIYMAKERDYNIIKAFILHELGHIVMGDLQSGRRPCGRTEARAQSWAIAFAIHKLMSEDISGILIDLAKSWSDLTKTKGNKIYIRASKILQKGWST